MDYRKPRARRGGIWTSPKVKLTAIVSGVVVLLSVGIAGAMQLMGGAGKAIAQPEAAIVMTLKDIKISATLATTDARGSTTGGYDWYACSIDPTQASRMVETLRARSDGKRVRSVKKPMPLEKAPNWWTPTSTADLVAFEMENSEYWVGVSQGQGKVFLRKMRH
jgi:hypothetical protein